MANLRRSSLPTVLEQRSQQGGKRRSIADLFHTSAALQHKIKESTQSEASAVAVSANPSRKYSQSTQFKLEDGKADRLRSILSRYVLLPSSPFLLYWDVVVFFGLIATGALFPCTLVFDSLNNTPSVVTGVALSSLFIFDTFLHFFRATRVSTREGVVLVTYLPDLCRLYLEGNFIVDALSACPFVLLTLIDKSSKPLLIIRICMPMLRFVRMPRLMVRLQAVTRWSFRVVNALEFGLISFLVLHWIACAWASLGSTDETSWLTAAKKQYPFLDADDHSDARLYMVSLYWSVTVLTSVGFGDITPQNWWEFVCATICMSIGGGVWAFVVGSVCGMASASDKHRNAFESQMNDVSVICKERKLPTSLQERLREFYKHSQDFMRMKAYHDTIHDLSPGLKGEVISWMYGSCFRRVWYFDVLDERSSLILAEGMAPRMYAPEEFIEDNVDNARALVFLRSGLCVRKNNLLAPGAVWGLDVILGSEEHEDIDELLDTELARSINYVFVLKLSKHSIDHAASLSPAFARRLRRAHCRMLLWRGVIAAARAEKKIQENKEHPETHTHVSHWDRLGKLMGQVVHRDRLLLEDQSNPTPLSRKTIRGAAAASLSNLPLTQRTCMADSRRESCSSIVSSMSRQTSPAQSELWAANDDAADNAEDWRLPTDWSIPSMLSHSPSAPELPHRRTKSPAGIERRDSPCTSGRTRSSVRRSQISSALESERRQLSARTPREHSNFPSRPLSTESRESAVPALLSNWRFDVKNGLEQQATKLKNFRSEVQADVETLREDVQQLHRLMHQLLTRLDAEEKY